VSGASVSFPPPSAASSWPGRSLLHFLSAAPERARTSLWRLSVIGAAFLLAALVAMSTSVLRLGQADGTLTARQLLWCVLGCAGVLSVPAIAWAQMLFWHAWPNTARVVDLVIRARRVLSASLLSYTAGALLARLVPALRPGPLSASWPGWDLIVFPIALLVGGIAAGLEAQSAPPSSRSEPPSLRVP
jgi:hypothetical protein